MKPVSTRSRPDRLVDNRVGRGGQGDPPAFTKKAALVVLSVIGIAGVAAIIVLIIAALG